MRYFVFVYVDLFDDEDGDFLRLVKECCGVFDFVKVFKNVKISVLKDIFFLNGDVDLGFLVEGRGLVFLDVVVVFVRDDEDVNFFLEEDRVSFLNVEDGSFEDV